VRIEVWPAYHCAVVGETRHYWKLACQRSRNWPKTIPGDNSPSHQQLPGLPESPSRDRVQRIHLAASRQLSATANSFSLVLQPDRHVWLRRVDAMAKSSWLDRLAPEAPVRGFWRSQELRAGGMQAVRRQHCTARSGDDHIAGCKPTSQE
jgi:hypothetical protein